MSLYEQIGGGTTVEKAVASLLGGISEDDAVSHWFAHVDFAGLGAHLVDFLTVNLGGPENYTGRSLRTAHEGRGITGEAFATVIGHIGAGFAAAGVAPHLVEQIVAKVDRMRAVIVPAT